MINLGNKTWFIKLLMLEMKKQKQLKKRLWNFKILIFKIMKAYTIIINKAPKVLKIPKFEIKLNLNITIWGIKYS